MVKKSKVTEMRLNIQMKRFLIIKLRFEQKDK